MKFTCPCCGYKTFDGEAIGTYEICELCNWEDDPIQNADPDYEGGANGYSLREAQHFFLKENLDADEYEKDEKWTLLAAPSKESRLKNSKIDFIVDKAGKTRNA
jgi:hypothetical protein